MAKTTWWVIGVLLTIAAIAFFLAWRGQKTDTDQSTGDAGLPTSIPEVTPATTMTLTPTATVGTIVKSTPVPTSVSYDGSAFSPATVTIEIGTVVTFTNTSSNSLRVASDPHPTHTDLPGFDSVKTLKKGESYSFTFTKTGSWGYHNHLASSHKGTIVVVTEK